MEQKSTYYLNQRERVLQHSYMKKEKLDYYVELHENPWPGVVQGIKQDGPWNYSIWLFGTELYNYFELKSEEELQSEPAKEKVEIKDGDWGSHTRPCFLYDEQGIYYDPIQEIAHDLLEWGDAKEDISKKYISNAVMRKVFRFYLNPEKLDVFVQLQNELGFEQKKLLSDCGIRNYSISLRGTEVYVYFEYIGQDYDTDIYTIKEHAVLRPWCEKAEACLLHREKGILCEQFRKIFLMND